MLKTTLFYTENALIIYLRKWVALSGICKMEERRALICFDFFRISKPVSTFMIRFYTVKIAKSSKFGIYKHFFLYMFWWFMKVGGKVFGNDTFWFWTFVKVVKFWLWLNWQKIVFSTNNLPIFFIYYKISVPNDTFWVLL